MIHIIGLMKQVTLVVMLICLSTGIDLAHLVVYRELKLTVLNGLGQDYIDALYQVCLLPVFVIFFVLCSSIVASKITKEELTVVQDFGLQLASYNI